MCIKTVKKFGSETYPVRGPLSVLRVIYRSDFRGHGNTKYDFRIKKDQGKSPLKGSMFSIEGG